MRQKAIIYFVIVLVSFLPFFAVAQSVDLVVKERGDKKINSTITITTKTGEGVPKETEFQKSQNIYFKLVPQKGNLLFKFTKRDVDSLKQYLTVVQGKKYFWPSDAEVLKTNFPTNEMTGVLLTYDRSNLDITQPFIFSYFDKKTKEIQIKENLWKGYDTFLALYEGAKKTVDEDKYAALKSLAAFTPKSPPSMKFSFSADAVALYTSIIKGIVDSYDKGTSEIEALSADERFNEVNSKKISEMSAKWKTEAPKLVPLLDKENKEQADILVQMTEVNKRFVNLANGYVLQVLYDYDYNEYKFELFINTISKLLIFNIPEDYIVDLKPIDLKVLDQLKDEKADLTKYGFTSEFTKLIDLINSNIKQGKYVLDPNVVERLKVLKSKENYPNYEIIDAFNALAQKDVSTFNVKIHKVADVATTHQLVYELSGWMAALYYTEKKVDIQVIKLINEGKKYLETNNIVKAGDTFEMAYRLNRIMPITQYYVGLAYYLQGQEYTGIKFFNNALRIEPSLTIPYVKELEFYIQEEQWNEGLKMTEQALKQHPKSWFFLHSKAKMLYELGKYTEAKTLIRDQMIEIRPQEIGQYFLAGDIYLKQDSLQEARDWYNKAGDIDPTNLMYEEKMRDWEAEKKKSGVKSKQKSQMKKK
ncbi:tetratricopeptide repeat protein [Halosquirtibacter xylanolyticus]|uniref:tetratricopeptide repeat protein n=1 Tax=Halosquirtibacter xylanolyticus TaxID=3374599 RepID=UPI003747B809|nr:tetratricopeptide repeat protein [Prolixibacteraceae bacterium]